MLLNRPQGTVSGGDIGRYQSVDTGKYCGVLLFVSEVVDRILGDDR